MTNSTSSFKQLLSELVRLPISWLYLVSVVIAPVIFISVTDNNQGLVYWWVITAIAALVGIYASYQEKKLLGSGRHDVSDTSCKGYRLLMLVTLITLPFWGIRFNYYLADPGYWAVLVAPGIFVHLFGMALLFVTIIAMACIKLSHTLVLLLKQTFVTKSFSARSFYFSLIFVITAFIFVFIAFVVKADISIPGQQLISAVVLTLNGMGITLALRHFIWQSSWRSLRYVLVHWSLLPIPLLLLVADVKLQTALFICALLLQSSLWFVWLTAQWRQPLRNQVNANHNIAPSIASQPQNYIDHQGHAQEISDFVRAAANSAVVGITGIRGAGKSALLATISANLADDYRVMQMTAPTRKDEGMAFFMTVCRNLCREVILDTRHRIQGEQAPEKQANRESSSRIRWLLLAVLVLLLGSAYTLYLFDAKGVAQANQNRQQLLQLPDRLKVYLSDNQQDNDQYRHNIVNHVLTTEQSTLQDLLEQIDQQLKSLSDPDKNQPTFYLDWGDEGLVIGQGKSKQGSSQQNQQQQNQQKDRPAITEFLINPPFTYHDLVLDIRSQYGLTITTTALVEDAFKFPSQTTIEPVLTRYMGFILSDTPEPPLNTNTGFNKTRPEYAYPFSGFNIAFTYLAVVQLETRLKQASPLRFHAQQLRTLLPTIHDHRDPQGRPLHLLPGWILAQALTDNDQSLTLTVGQLRQLEVILKRYQQDIGAGKDLSAAIKITDNTPGFVMWLSQSFGFVNNTWVQLSGLILVILLICGSWMRRSFEFIVRAILNPEALALLRESERFIDLLSYKEDKQQSAGLQYSLFSMSRSVSKQARDLSLPGLTAHFADYTALLAKYYNGKVIIAIDELDKIHNIEEVKDLLVEIKGALSLPHCYYLLTISEDCAQSFGKRLSGGRDIFESSFDEIVSVSRLNFATVNAIANKLMGGASHKVKLSEENCRVVLLYGGGIAREIMRSLRVLMIDQTLEAEPRPFALGARLFARQWLNWIEQLCELPVSGKLASELHYHAYNAHLLVHCQLKPALSHDDLLAVQQHIDASITLLDPDEQRQQTIWSQPPEDLDEQQVFAARLAAFQTLIRLSIMAKLTLWLRQHNHLSGVNEALILECFRVLPQQPALAEYILAKLE